MIILPELLEFEWDKGNFDKNLKRHKVTFREAEEVFDNKPFLASEDIKHSQEERRFQALGQTNQERRLFISFTVRKNKIRIISARNMSKKEEVKYEKV